MLAFDTYYDGDLAASGVVDLVNWPPVEEVDEKIDRQALAPLVENAVTFARENAQEIWLQRHIAWTLELLPARI